MAENNTKILNLDIGDYCRLFSYCKGTVLQTILYLLLIAKMNPEEVSALEWENLDLENNIAFISEEKIIKLPESVVSYLKETRYKQLESFFLNKRLNEFRYVCVNFDLKPFSGKEISDILSQYLKNCGHENLTLKKLWDSFPEYLYSHDMVSKVITMFDENTRLLNPIEIPESLQGNKVKEMG